MRRRLPSPAMVVALIALGVALGGTSVAATTGLVTGTQLRVQKQPPSVNLVRLQRQLTALERKSEAIGDKLNRICPSYGALVSSASVDSSGHLSVTYVRC